MKPSTSKSQLATLRLKNMVDEKTNPSTSTANRQKSYTQTVNNSKQYKQRQIKLAKQQEIGIRQHTNTVKSQQLFSIVQTFYNTLCNLPLQKLISSSEPGLWLGQQESTLRQLERKLQKLNKHKDYEYYRWKLQSVDHILSNIGQNMNMLQRITHLKNYYSGTDTSNYRSRGSSSCESETRQIKLGDFASDRSEVKQLLSYDHYIIKPENKRIEGRSPDIMAQTVNSEEDSSLDNQPLVSSQMLQKKKEPKRQRVVPKEGENRNSINAPQKMPNYSQLATGKGSCQMKDKTLVKVHNSKATNSQRTLSNFTVEGRFLQDRIMQEINENNVQNVIKKNPKTVDASKVQYSEQCDSSIKQNGLGEYLQMIKELRLQLMSKDKQIERLLISQQEYDESIQLIAERQKHKDTEILFLKESISNNSRDKQKLQLEIKRLTQIQEELKETIRFERDRNRREEREKQKVQQKYYEQTNCRQQLLQQIKRLHEENRQCRKNERVMKQKMEVYSKKYFKIYREYQQIKEAETLLISELQQLKSKNSKNNSTRYQQIMQIVQYHKSRLSDQSQYL